MADTVQSLVEELDLPAVVELFQINFLTDSFYFTNSIRAEEIWWNGNRYLPLPITIANIGYTEDNYSEPTRITLSNVGLRYQLLFANLPNLKGGRVYYVKTFETYISPSSLSNTSIFISKNVYHFTKLVEKNRNSLTYQLDSPLNDSTAKLPTRQMLRDGRLNLRFEGLGVNKHL